MIDTAKMVAVLGGQRGSVHDFVGQPEKITNVAPLIAVPTTASSGSEVSPGCGIHPDADKRAIGTRSHNLVPRVAICDPELTFSLPPRLTAGTGLDALSHCIEGYLSKVENPLIDASALDGIRHVRGHIERAVSVGDDREARWHMTLAGIAGGIAIAKGLGPAHAMANALGNRGFHHGLLCAIALPVAIEVVAPHVPGKMKKLAEALGLDRSARISSVLRELNSCVGVPASLGDAGFGAADFEELATDAVASPFNRASPYVPTFDEYCAMFAITLHGKTRRPTRQNSTRKCAVRRGEGFVSS